MKIIVCHNYYRDRGGEDQVFEEEVALLRERGHTVETFIRRNDDFSGLQTLAVAAGTVWNRGASADVATAVRELSADIVHFHNWLPQISQGAFHAARSAGAAVVQTLHNYRFTCAKGVLYRDGSLCEECVGKAVGWPAIVHGCYRDSRIATVPVVAALATHRVLRTSERTLDAVIVLSEFARSKLIEAGLPAKRVHVKPNFVAPDPGPRSGDGGYFVYIGRLSEEKGLATLLAAWQSMQNPPLLKIAGSGPQIGMVEAAASANPSIEYLGRIPPSEVPTVLGNAAFSIVPSVNYEGFPKAIVESFAVGTPVIGADLGSLPELISVGKAGYLFEPGSASSLAGVVGTAGSTGSPAGMRALCRETYLERYGVDRNYARLMEIYASAVAARATPS